MKPKEILSALFNDIAKCLNIEVGKVFVEIYENSAGTQWTLAEFLSSYNPEDVGKGQCNLMFRVDIDEGLDHISIASFQLRDMYHCSGIMIASDLHVHVKYRKLGIGTVLTKFVIDFTKYYGHGIVQANDKVNNEYQVKIFTKLGWKTLATFRNPKTKNEIHIWAYNLN